MFDRYVQQIEPKVDGDEVIRPFSAVTGARNLIVLGDPGAGKTVLFKQAAADSDGMFLTVRHLLSTPVERLPRDRPLWIDGLDESRSGRGDYNTVDAVVRRLWELQAPAVRLSCRVADWLGKSDLAAFSPYFEQNGGPPCVVQLSPLSKEEQEQILAQNGINMPAVFLEEAQRRGLHAMLINPQSLLMLAKAVDGRQWPETRTELFAQAVTLLLQEHNETHGEREQGAGQYSPRELMTAAGALCALRLVSDCNGFSLQPNGDDETPSCREIDLATPETLRAALMRRVFVSTAIHNVVDYVHRTIAEYLGAQWLADRIAEGLPLGRVQALFGINGHPASSLRGLQAWLAVLSPESAATLIDTDPMGIVMYADAAKLGAIDKKRLIEALTWHAERDPWFYHGSHGAYGIGALSDLCMIDTFRGLLLSKSAPLPLKMLVVDTQIQGQPLHELRDELQAILGDASAPYHLRDGCLDVLCAMGQSGAELIFPLYSMLGKNKDGLRLQITAIRALYGHGLDADAFVNLIYEIVEFPYDLPIGSIYGLSDVVPRSDAEDILDQLDFTARMPERGYSHRKSRDLTGIYETLIVKAIEKTPFPEATRLYAWLCVLQRYARSYHLEGLLKRAFENRNDLADLVLDAWIACFDAGDLRQNRWFEFQRVFAECFSSSRMFDRLHHAIGRFESDKECFILRRMLEICLGDPEGYGENFWALYDYAAKDNALIEIRDIYCVSQVEGWRIDDQEFRLRRSEEDAASRQEAILNFEQNRAQILSGEHLGWMAEIGSHYFGHNDVDDRSLDPMERLFNFFGKDRAEVAIIGLKALVAHRRISPFSEIISCHLEKKLWPWWYGILAGLDCLPKNKATEFEFTDDFLVSAIAIACFHPVYRHEGNTIRSWDHTWLQHAIHARPDLVRRTYAAIAEVDLAAGERYPEGLSELQNPELVGSHRGLLVEHLLTRFPQMHSDALERLLRMATEDEIWPRLQVATAAGVAAEIENGDGNQNDRKETRRLWLAFGFLTEPGLYRSQIQSLSDDDAGAMVWLLLKVGSLNRHRSQDFGVYSTNQLEFVAEYVGFRYPFTPRPAGVTSGSKNDWDVSDAIGNILATISVNTDDFSRDALLRLSKSQALVSYSEQAKHLLAQQQVRRVDAEHRLPAWRSAMTTLANRAPCSAQDLHALVLAHLREVCRYIAHANTDPYKQFWNTARYDRLSRPKSEDLARDALIELLRPRLQPIGLRVEPEGHMARDKRADIVIFFTGMKCVIELKRDFHREVWTAAKAQLERLYARDLEASGYGIYGVFWYGDKRKTKIPKNPSEDQCPKSSLDMQRILESTIPEHHQHKIKVIVFDVSGEMTSD